jgi:hypothetical protein
MVTLLCWAVLRPNCIAIVFVQTPLVIIGAAEYIVHSEIVQFLAVQWDHPAG